MALPSRSHWLQFIWFYDITRFFFSSSSLCFFFVVILLCPFTKVLVSEFGRRNPSTFSYFSFFLFLLLLPYLLEVGTQNFHELSFLFQEGALSSCVLMVMRLKPEFSLTLCISCFPMDTSFCFRPLSILSFFFRPLSILSSKDPFLFFFWSFISQKGC